MSGERAAVKYIDNQCLLRAVFKMEDSWCLSSIFFFILTSGIAHYGPVKSVDTSTWGVRGASGWALFCGRCQLSVSGDKHLSA